MLIKAGCSAGGRDASWENKMATLQSIVGRQEVAGDDNGILFSKGLE